MFDPADAMCDPAAAGRFGPAPTPAPSRTGVPADPEDGLLDRLAHHLAPLFVTDADDLPAGRLMAVRTIAAYQPKSQADLINIGRAISFSMSAVAALSRAASPDMPPAMQLRYLARANTLNRCADQSERAIERRRRFLRSSTPSAQTAWMAAKFDERMAAPAMPPDAMPPDEQLHTTFGDPADTAFDEAAVDVAVAEAIRNHAAGVTATSQAEATDDLPWPAAKSDPACCPSGSPPASWGEHAACLRDPRPDAALGTLAVRHGGAPLQPVHALTQRRAQDLIRELTRQRMTADHGATLPR